MQVPAAAAVAAAAAAAAVVVVVAAVICGTDKGSAPRSRFSRFPSQMN